MPRPKRRRCWRARRGRRYFPGSMALAGSALAGLAGNRAGDGANRGNGDVLRDGIVRASALDLVRQAERLLSLAGERQGAGRRPTAPVMLWEDRRAALASLMASALIADKSLEAGQVALRFRRGPGGEGGRRLLPPGGRVPAPGAPGRAQWRGRRGIRERSTLHRASTEALCSSFSMSASLPSAQSSEASAAMEAWQVMSLCWSAVLRVARASSIRFSPA